MLQFPFSNNPVMMKIMNLLSVTPTPLLATPLEPESTLRCSRDTSPSTPP